MYERSARYREVIKGSHRVAVRAWLLTEVPQFGPSPEGLELPVLGGRVKLASRSDVKGTLDLTVPGDYWDELQPYGAEVFVERGVDFGDGTQEYAPLGYYRIDELDQERRPYGKIRIEARDRIAHLIDMRTVYPHPYPVSTHRELTERLINADPALAPDGKRKGYGIYETAGVTMPISWTDYDPDAVSVAAGVCEDDVYEHLAKIFDGRGCVLTVARTGEFVVRSRDRAPGALPVLTVGAGEGGTLVRASRSVSRRGVYNMVVARSSDPEVPVAVGLDYIDDPTSPLRWYGPFGPIPRYYASPLIKTPEGAQAAAETIQARYKGLPTSTAVALVPDPSVDPLDPVAIVVGGTSEVHLVDEVEIPLVVNGEVRIDTRALNEVPDAGPGDIPDPGGEPDPGESATAPWELLKIGSPAGWNSFKWGIGFSPGDDPQGTSGAIHRDYSRAQIQAGLSIPGYFELIGGRVRMSTPLDGGRTSAGTQYPRVEGREMALDGTTNAAWNPSTGTHECLVRGRVTRMPPNKPQLVLCQVHDADDDTVMIRLESKTRLVAKFGDTIVGDLTTSFAFDTDYDYGIRVVDGQIRWYFGPAGHGFTTPLFTHNGFVGVSTPQYFKAGCYAQSNTSYDALTDGPFIVEMSRLQCWHTGYPAALGFDETPGTSWSANVFVATTGSDSNDGLTEATAKATLAGGLAAASAGQTIKVMPGTYSGNFVTSKGGSSGSPITIRSATKWGARIEGDGDGDEAAVQISHQHIRLQDFEICGDDTETCRIGVLVEANNVELLGNNIHDVCLFPTEGTGYQGGAGIDFGGQTSFSNILVDGNVIHDCGIPEIEQLVHGIYCGVHGTNFRITNNVIYGCQDFGVHPYDETEASGIQIINNTVIGNGRGILQAPNGITRNNISYNNATANYDIRGSGNVVENNLSGGTGNVTRSGVTSGVNPLFVSYALDGSGDFRLQSGSPAVGAGTASGAPTKDIAGVTRPQGPAIDCGAYEQLAATGGGTDPGSGSPVPGTATSIFASDFAGGDPLAGTPVRWGTVQNKNYNGNSSGAGLSAYPLTIVNGGTDHETACRFEVRSGDTAISGERSELRYPSAVNIAQGEERWFEFDMKFDADFQGVSTSGWLIVFQLHPNDSVGGSPQLDLTVREDETLRLRLHETAYFTVGSITDAAWHRYALYLKAHTSNGSALTKVFRDGTEVVSSTERNLKSGSTSGNYFKTGIYRNSQSFTSKLQLDRVRVWTP